MNLGYPTCKFPRQRGQLKLIAMPPPSTQPIAKSRAYAREREISSTSFRATIRRNREK